jgi:hypothetical protein
MFADLAAPADSLYTPVPFNYQNGRYLSGTSAAVPFVAATVAALLSADATLNLQAIDRLLKNSATPLEIQNPMYYGNLGAGLLNIESLIGQWKRHENPEQHMQPEGYVWLGQLSQQQAVMVKPAGKYPAIKWHVPNTAGKRLPDLRLRIFAAGSSRDTLWPGADLPKQLELQADSVAWYSMGKANKRSNDWLYYKAQTIDSSKLYCSGLQMIISGKGEITDGSGALPYAGRCDCKWQLTAPEGKRISIRFTEQDTEAKIDYIYIFNGTHTNQPILAMFSGNELPPEITSWGNEVLIWFATNDKVHGQGWKLLYEVVD